MERLGLFLPLFSDELGRCQTAQGLQSARMIVGIDEEVEMPAKPLMIVVVVALGVQRENDPWIVF